jgi:uncharacterized protein (DUF1499 family)
MNQKLLAVLLFTTFLAGCAGTVPRLGITNGELSPCPITPNCVNTQAKTGVSSIQALLFSGTQPEAKERLLTVLKQMKRTQVTQERVDYIRAESSSAIFRFVDDLEFYFPSQESGKIIIHMRSASRFGISDLGVNKKRIESIRDKFNAN